MRSHSARRDVRPDPVDVVADQPFEVRARRRGQIAVRDPDRDRADIRARRVLGQDVRRGPVVDDRDASARRASAQPARSSPASPRRPGPGSPPAAHRGTTAGLAPRNDGVLPMTCPSASVTWIATWCPPTRHDHGARASGSPKTANQYSSGSRRVQPPRPPSRSSAPRTVSRRHDRADLTAPSARSTTPRGSPSQPAAGRGSCPGARAPPGCPVCTPRRTVRSCRTGRRPLHAASRRARRARLEPRP